MQDVLHAIHAHYTRMLTWDEHAAAMAAGPCMRRLMQVAWQEGRRMHAWQLMESRIMFEGLQRASWDPCLPMYVVQLTC